MPDHWQKMACSMRWCCPTMADACGTPSMQKLALQSAYNAQMSFVVPAIILRHF
jgi:hypothetical protein